jgi:hypothetical protein
LESLFREPLIAGVRRLTYLMARHLVFVVLIGVFGVSVYLCGVPLFVPRFRGPLGVPLVPFVIGAWVTCYWDGPETRAVLPSTNFRSEAILIGVGVMLFAAVMQFRMLLFN